MKNKMIREKETHELKKMLNELRLELAKERAQIKIGAAPSNPSKVRNTRKMIARILTEIKRREEEKTGRSMS